MSESINMLENKRKTPREYMKMAIEVMKHSIQERSKNDPNPYVGAVLVLPDGTVYTAYRGEYREGDHAEYTVLDKKNRQLDLTGSWLFTTLEPCAPGSRNEPKLSCSERIANARISKVWFGIQDPHPKVDHGGIDHLLDKGVEIDQFDPDLHRIIEEINKDYLKWANIKKAEAEKFIEVKPADQLDKKAEHTDLTSLSPEAISFYLTKSDSTIKFNSPEFIQELKQMELLSEDGNNYIPTGNAILLFGKNPRNKFQQASVKAKVDYGNNLTGNESFDDPLVLIPKKVENWLKKVIPESFNRSQFTREKVPFYPPSVILEAIINAIIHRDYSIDKAKVQLEVFPERIVVKSPGKPIPPVTVEKMKNFTATSYSRNKKLAFIFNQMKYMEETGVGMDTYRSLRDKYQLPLPIITYDEPYLIITFPRSADAVREFGISDALKQLNDEELAGYDFVKSRKEVSKKEYAYYFKFSDKKAQRHLIKFKDLNLVKLEGKGPSSKYIIIE